MGWLNDGASGLCVDESNEKLKSGLCWNKGPLDGKFMKKRFHYRNENSSVRRTIFTLGLLPFLTLIF